ncbi:hypothetical protein [Clostridium sp.]|uniref:hypothetical protein n=1 Tax=Clostridium sp. TaxID=1506 RepID=UPI001A58662C|nr:hypothetical protein [Clostridium sp.]MBK5236415.1 hypothetical protein [Clostridium sp.]
MAKIGYGQANLESSDDDFTKVIYTLNQLIHDESAKIIFGIEEDTKVEVDEKALDKFDIDIEMFSKIVNTEFVSILEAILSNTEKDFISIQYRQSKDDEVKDENEEMSKELFKKAIGKKIDYTKEVIVTNEIKSRYMIKATTKISKLKKINWEINKKLYDNEKEKLSANYATISIKVGKELNEMGSLFRMFPFIENDYKIDEISFDCDEYDIDYIIKIFEKVKDTLKKC